VESKHENGLSTTFSARAVGREGVTGQALFFKNYREGASFFWVQDREIDSSRRHRSGQSLTRHGTTGQYWVMEDSRRPGHGRVGFHGLLAAWGGFRGWRRPVQGWDGS
jgi:hypothetical protein